jgi:hypothetical protein
MAMNQGRAIFAGRLVAIGLTLTVGVWATSAYGVGGAAAGMFLANLGLAAVLAFVLLRRNDAHVADSVSDGALIAARAQL